MVLEQRLWVFLFYVKICANSKHRKWHKLKCAYFALINTISLVPGKYRAAASNSIILQDEVYEGHLQARLIIQLKKFYRLESAVPQPNALELNM